MLRRPEGKIVLSGPTGSGKSTTLRSACRVYLDDDQGRHLLTIEDPLEGQILGATQTPDYLRQIRRRCRQTGMESGYFIGNAT